MISYEYFSERATAWRRHHGALVPLSMPHAVTPLSIGQAWRLLVCRGAPFVRWDEAFDKVKMGEWWHLIKDDPEDISELGKKARNQVRRGARKHYVVALDRDAVIRDGYSVYRAAFGRYETFERMLSAAEFRDAVGALPSEAEFWGVRDRDTGKLVAFSENVVRDGACFYDTIWFEPEALKAYAGYVLFHEMNKHYLNERGLHYVSDGARNISHQTNVHEFLEQKFGFRRAYARLRVVYFPGLGLAVRLLYPLRKWFARRTAAPLQKVAVLLEQERIRRSCVRAGDGG